VLSKLTFVALVAGHTKLAGTVAILVRGRFKPKHPEVQGVQLPNQPERTMTADAAGAAGELGNCKIAESPDESSDWFLMYHTLLHVLLIWLMIVTVHQWCQLRVAKKSLPPPPPPVLMPEQTPEPKMPLPAPPPPPVLMPEQTSSGHLKLPYTVTLVTTQSGDRFHVPGCGSLKKAIDSKTARYFTACASCVGMRYPTTH
jgi:hypothetical protein